MTSESEKGAVIRKWVEAFNRLDFDTVLGDMDPEIELSEWPAAPGAGTYHGLDGVRAAVDSWLEAWEWMEVEIEDLFFVDDRVLVTLYQRVQGKGSEVVVEIRSFNVYTFAGSSLTRIQLFTERELALEAAGLKPDYEEEKR